MPRKTDPAVVAARIALTGTILTTLATVVTAYVKPGDVLPRSSSAGPQSVDCLDVLDRFDRYLSDDPGRITVFVTPGAGGSSILTGDTGARQCGLTPGT